MTATRWLTATDAARMAWDGGYKLLEVALRAEDENLIAAVKAALPIAASTGCGVAVVGDRPHPVASLPLIVPDRRIPPGAALDLRRPGWRDALVNLCYARTRHLPAPFAADAPLGPLTCRCGRVTWTPTEPQPEGTDHG